MNSVIKNLQELSLDDISLSERRGKLLHACQNADVMRMVLNKEKTRDPTPVRGLNQKPSLYYEGQFDPEKADQVADILFRQFILVKEEMHDDGAFFRYFNSVCDNCYVPMTIKFRLQSRMKEFIS